MHVEVFVKKLSDLHSEAYSSTRCHRYFVLVECAWYLVIDNDSMDKEKRKG